MTALSDAVLPLIRTRASIWQWRAANDHGAKMHEAVDILVEASESADPADVLTVTQKAIASALKVVMRADDSSGIIGDACRRLLALHPTVVARAKPSPAKLVDWMIAFQFSNDCDFFTIDPVDYAPALGDKGMSSYRAKLAELEESWGPRPPADRPWDSPHRHDWFTADQIAQRLAVFDRDVEAIIRTHAREQRVAAWLQDAAEALVEIGEFDLAIEWARKALDIGPSHQSLKAGEYWCSLLLKHRPTELLSARKEVFQRWPIATTAGRLYLDAGRNWPELQDSVLDALSANPRESVIFVLTTLKDVPRAWQVAHSLSLKDDQLWSDLAKAYEKVDPAAVLPILARLVLAELVDTNPRNYRGAARRLKRMYQLAADTDNAAEIERFIADLRETHKRRPRLQQEFDRAGLP